MTIYLRDILDGRDLETMLETGYVRDTVHPTRSLAILNYSERAAFDKIWNPVTLACRGLIYDCDTGIIVARPWGKFFNYGEQDVDLPLHERVEVTDKIDGSLGILYNQDGGEIATRGSFASDQAKHATALYQARYLDKWKPQPDITYLFEIVYPANRIVLDYRDLDDLILLGGVVTDTGQTLGPDDIAEWPGLRTETLGATTLAVALALPTRENREGVVVRYLDTDTLVKIKQPDYVALHRLVTGLNERVVWEHLGAGGTVAGLCEPLPDEFRAWVEGVAQDLQVKALRIVRAAKADFRLIVPNMDPQALPGNYRRAFAEQAVMSEHRALLFMLLDGKDIYPAVWKSLRPEHNPAAPDFLRESEDA